MAGSTYADWVADTKKQMQFEKREQLTKSKDAAKPYEVTEVRRWQEFNHADQIAEEKSYAGVMLGVVIGALAGLAISLLGLGDSDAWRIILLVFIGALGGSIVGFLAAAISMEHEPEFRDDFEQFWGS